MRKSLIINTLNRTLAFFLVILITSCSKSITNTRPVSDLAALQTKIDKRHQFFASNSIKYKFKSVVSLAGKDNKIVGKVSVFADSSLHISILSYSVGVELAQLFVNTDSVFIVNKIDKEYYSGSYADFADIFDFSLCYSIFSDSYFGNSISTNNCHYLSDFKKFIVNDLYKSDIISNYFVSTQFDSFGNVEKIDYKSYDGNYLKVNYSNFVANYNFPAEIVLVASFKKKSIELKMDVDNVDLLKNKSSIHSKPSIENYKKRELKDVEI